VSLRQTETRYEWLVDGQVAAVADFTDDGTTVVLPRVETAPALRGRGHASDLVAAVLDDLRSQGRRVVPACPFAAAFVRDHPAYADLLA
jgi:predicted GNAT family acetyltransferase